MFRSPRLLIAARVMGGLTQAELAAAAGIAMSVLQSIEQGRSDPRLSTTLALLNALEAHGVRLVPASDQAAYGLVVVPGSRAEDIGNTGGPTKKAMRQTQSDPSLNDVEPVAKRIGRGRSRKQAAT